MIDINRVCRNMEGILDFLHEFRREVREGRDIFLVGETNGIDPSGLKDWAGPEGAFDMAIEFSHTSPEFVHGEKWCEPQEWQLPFRELLQHRLYFLLSEFLFQDQFLTDRMHFIQ